MIITEIYKGQGFGNQLWCYVTTRLLAEDLGYEFGIQSPEKFKGLDFMDIDFGKQVFGGKGPEGGPPLELPRNITHYHAEHTTYHPSGADIRMRDEALMNVADRTKIDGCLQDCDYILKHRDKVRSWLKVRADRECYDYSADNICVINFRGGGYVHDKEFFLRTEYWTHAIANMRKVKADLTFIVITDDVVTAKKFFPDFDVYHFDIGKDFIVIKNAHYLILSNSSFAQFPAIMSEKLKYCIAPKYWGRHNSSDGYWSLGYSIMDGWNYQDREGNISDAATCKKEWAEYWDKNKDSFTTEYPLSKKAPTANSLFTTTKIQTKKVVKNALGKLAASRIGWKIKEYTSERKAAKQWHTPQEIAEHRKKIRVYDVFSFFNELDLLEIRMGILDPYVDYFVIAEATETFSGQPKPLHYLQNKNRYKKWNHKIIHCVIDDVPQNEDDLRSRLHGDIKKISILDRTIISNTLTTDTISRDVAHWMKEFYIKESARKGIENIRDDDFCYISDLDEVWNPNRLIDYSSDAIFKLKQTGYIYFLNNRTNENDWDVWTGTVATKYKNIKNRSINLIRTHKKMKDEFVYLKNGGWHFGYQGGYEGAKKKIVESAHFWYRPETTLPNLEDRVKKNIHVRGNKKVKIWIDEKGLPAYILNSKEKYKKFFK